ncbi:hypothetical protein SAMN05216326_12572 [Nitrosomonas marina]|uniref:Uncharacterized protein n=1 Tax=Nitrosomonas marina TaxID=917 RepID=A0A1I0EB11_9PROT|nr:hypothetical protein [Nitrosomonas marina]SET41566.1 hypothetical protein SAMN05216326_12572 [Nitrosomonas marina]
MTKEAVVQQVEQDCYSQSAEKATEFVNSLLENSAKGSTFDSASANDFAGSVVNQGDTGVEVPESMQIVLDEAYCGASEDEKKRNRAKIIKAIFDGVGTYQRQHGVSIPPDISNYAIHMGFAATDFAANKYKLDRVKLDSASSAHHDQLSLQPNRAVVAILSAFGDAIPFAHYLPADIGSNEAKLAILSHEAGHTYGQYAQGDSMDGVNSGKPYLTSSRIHALFPTVSTGDIDGKLTKLQATPSTCDQAADAVKLLRGRAVLYVKGMVAAREVDSEGSGNSVVSGSITISGTTYTIGGNINTDTGVFALTTTPALPETVPVAVESFVDYERGPENIPSMLSAVRTRPLFAKPWRGFTQVTPDARTQISQELGLDAHGEAMVAIQRQLSGERHYEVLEKALRLGANNQVTFDFDWTNRKTYMHRSDAWRDLASALGVASQQMAIDTFDHGISHLYIGKYIMSDFLSLPSDIWQPSGVMLRPGIFRVGRLFGLYDVYYTPRTIQDTAGAAQILCVGRASSVALNPFVLGDSVPVTMIPLGVSTDLKAGVGVYGRSLTDVNPHISASLGCAIINVTNMQ